MTAQKGFTLVELLVVVSIITILSGILIPSFTSYIRTQNLKQAQQQLVSDLRTVQNKALTGTLSNEVIGTTPISYWGVWFENSTTYSYFISTDTTNTCNGWPVQGKYDLNPAVAIQSGGPTCIYFGIENGDIVERPAGRLTITLDHASGGSDPKEVLFNNAGLIYAND